MTITQKIQVPQPGEQVDAPDWLGREMLMGNIMLIEGTDDYLVATPRDLVKAGPGDWISIAADDLWVTKDEPM